MSENNITPDTLPEESDGEGAVEETKEETTETKEETSEKSVDALSLSELNEHLGKEFPTKDAALKSIKDTYSHVGKRTADIENEMKDKGYMTIEKAEEMFFLRDNPQHAENKTILEAIAAKEGITISEAAKTESYSKLFENSAKFVEHESNQSVMDSNPRIAEQKEKMDSVREMQSQGNVDGARELAAKTVMEAYMDNK